MLKHCQSKIEKLSKIVYFTLIMYLHLIYKLMIGNKIKIVTLNVNKCWVQISASPPPTNIVPSLVTKIVPMKIV